jgi:hypothetical protein
MAVTERDLTDEEESKVQAAWADVSEGCTVDSPFVMPYGCTVDSPFVMPYGCTMDSPFVMPYGCTMDRL